MNREKLIKKQRRTIGQMESWLDEQSGNADQLEVNVAILEQKGLDWTLEKVSRREAELVVHYLAQHWLMLRQLEKEKLRLAELEAGEYDEQLES